MLARYIADHAKENILVFAPNITILDEIRKAVGFSIPQVTYRTFQSLIRNREDNGLLRADHILIDEFHHFGAEIWGSALQEVIENNPCAYVLGTSATPIRPEGMIDTVDLYFEGNLFYDGAGGKDRGQSGGQGLVIPEIRALAVRFPDVGKDLKAFR